MLRALKSFFADAADTEGINADSRERELQLATAILLVELARADFSEDELELHVIRDLLQSHLSLSDREAGKLVDDAMQQADHSASLQSFTRLLHEDLSLEEKLEIIEMLWRVALADSKLDKHEDHLVRKIAGLLYVSHSDLIRVRNRVRDADA